MNDVRVFRREIINRAGRRRRQTKHQPLAAPFWPEVIPRFFGPGLQAVKRSYSGTPATGCTQMNGHPPLALIAAFSSGLTYNISQRVLI